MIDVWLLLEEPTMPFKASAGRRHHMLTGEPVRDVTARQFEMEPGKLLLHLGYGFASGALATVVVGTHLSRGTPMEWWQVMGDHERVEIRNAGEVRGEPSAAPDIADGVRAMRVLEAAARSSDTGRTELA